MPVIRSKGVPKHPVNVREVLTEQVCKELLGEGKQKGPTIFEIPTDQSNQIDVYVIWECWRGIPIEDRNEIVRDAYNRYRETLTRSLFSLDESDPPLGPLVPRVMITIASTWDEAETLETLPFLVRSGVERSHPELVGAEWVKRLMLEEGAIGDLDQPVFRFPTRTMAQEVCDRMNENLPEGEWSVIERLSLIDEL